MLKEILLEMLELISETNADVFNDDEEWFIKRFNDLEKKINGLKNI